MSETRDESHGKAEASGGTRLLSKQCEIGGRVFMIDLLLLSNGCFACISEDRVSRIGAITLSIKTAQQVASSALIPERKGSIFAGTLGELLAHKFNGIAITSLYFREEIDARVMKTLINEVSQLLGKD